METITTKLQKRRLEWLGHLNRMPDCRMPKIVLFSWLPQTRPCCGPKRRWRDTVKKDMQAVKIPTGAGTWYEEAQDRKAWHAAYSEGAIEHQRQQQQKRREQEARTIECSVCRRQFRREADKARHKCSAERRKPIHKQRGSVRCTVCGRWFRSRGDLAVHKCSTTEETPRVVDEGESESAAATQTTTRRQVEGVDCRVCGRKFCRP